MRNSIAYLAVFSLSAWTAMSAGADSLPNANLPGDPAPEMVSKSLVSMGDTARLQRVMAKARRGEKIVVGTIGGSITQGAAATTPENRWADLTAKWWRDRFPQAKVEFVNAGIGATGSNLGCHRAADHLLKYKPDFVVAEYAVNDPNNQLAAETLEGLVRQVLKQPNKPAMMLFFTMHPDGGNAQEWHSKVGSHYGLPMVSFRDAVLPEFQAGRCKWQDLLPDGIHPNDTGHGYAGKFIGSLLDKVLSAMPSDDKLPRIKRIPKPLISDTFEYTAMFNADSIKPVRNDGWTPASAWGFGNCWESSRPGSTLEFDIEGDTISLAYFRIKGGMGIAEAQIDSNPPMKMNGWFEADWGGYSHWDLITRDLEPGRHRLKIRLLNEKWPQSTGHKFQLQLVMEAGLNKK
ncbi:MAG: SGNH/GDSL hydrolase family protein [Armatimonadota bacterium]